MYTSAIVLANYSLIAESSSIEALGTFASALTVRKGMPTTSVQDGICRRQHVPLGFTLLR